MRLDICSRHLAHYREDDNFRQRIVTGDETCVHHYQPETQWKHPSSKEIQDAAISSKLMLTIFWVLKGLFLRPTWNVEQLSQVHPTETCFREG
jgi:hypothetical protein